LKAVQSLHFYCRYLWEEDGVVTGNEVNN